MTAWHYGREDDGCDNRGHFLVVGDTVAYNLSGEVAVGELVNITEGTKYGKPHTYYHVKLTHGHGYYARQEPARISKINSSKNLLAIHERSEGV